jgi:hypothetical protein
MTPIQEKMVKIASQIVKHYFTDVTVHDFASYQMMQIGEFRLWALRKTGTWMCNLAHPITFEKDAETLASVIVKNPEYTDGSRHLYLIHKIDENVGEIIPTNIEELQYLMN